MLLVLQKVRQGPETVGVQWEYHLDCVMAKSLTDECVTTQDILESTYL